jgi:hypothetical protein
MFIYAAALSVALTGGALAQSHSHQAQKSDDTMSATTGEGGAMKKIDHSAGAGSHSSKTSGHSHGAGHTASVEVPAELDTATSKLSEQQHYRVSIAPETPPVTINALHNWVLEVRVTEYLGDGRYLVEGVRFNMAGWWQVTFTIAGHHADRASFNIVTN